MIISPGRRYIFVHIPKTGGTALTQALESRAMKDDLLIGDTPKARKRRARVQGVQAAGRIWKHSRLSDIVGLVSDQTIADAFVFTLVRNPWDRTVSYYRWLRDQTFDHPAVHSAKATDFSGFLNQPHTQASLRADTFGSYVTNSAGCEDCAAFVRLEHLEADLAPVWSHLGFDLSPIARVNASDRGRDFRPYYSDADAGVLADVCATDIARFGYRFEDGA